MTRPAPDPGRWLASVPSLDALAADLSRVTELPVEVARQLLCQIHVLEGELFARALAGGRAEAVGESGDRNLDVSEAAAMLGLAVDTLYRRARKPPFVSFLVPTGTRRLLFSRRRIEDYIARARKPL